MLLGDLVKQNCDDAVPPVCTDDPERSWVSTTQFYAGLALVQVGGWGLGTGGRHSVCSEDPGRSSASPRPCPANPLFHSSASYL